MNFININLELSATICHKIFNMHVLIYHCGVIVKKQFICTKQLYSNVCVFL